MRGTISLSWAASRIWVFNAVLPRSVQAKYVGWKRIYTLSHTLERKIRAVGQVNIAFLLAKTRVAAIKKLMVPHLGVMGALIGARLASYVSQKLLISIAAIIFRTDSAITLGSIHGVNKKKHTFVSNRLTVIMSHSKPSQWRHCLGKQNPADLLTRRVSAEKLVKSLPRWNGSPWLEQEPFRWPEINF